MLRYDVKTYVKKYEVYLASQIVRHKPYRDLQSLPVIGYRRKDLFIDFVTNLSILIK